MMAKKKTAKKKTKQSKTLPKELRCFIIMPFSKAEFKDSTGSKRSLDQKKLKHLYTKLISKAVKEYNKKNAKFISVHRYEKTRGNFVKGIVNDLDNADLVIADLTGLNPNVFYELGIRHTLKVGTIMLTQDIASLPADLRSYVAFEYKYPEESDAFDEYYPLFKKELHKAIDEYLLDHKKGEYDNPVRDFIGDRQIFRNEIRIKQLQGNVVLLRYLQLVYSNDVNGLLSSLEKWAAGDKILYNMNTLPVIDKILSKLVTQNEDSQFINYLFGLFNSSNIIRANQDWVCERVSNSKEVTSSRKTKFGFYDYDFKYYHLLDLKKYHNKSNGQSINVDDPIVKSLKILKNHWQDELENLLQ